MISKEISILTHVSWENGNMAEWVTMIIALSAFYVTVKEYYSHIRRERANVLSRYNERYAEDESIKRVIKYINAVAYHDYDNDNTKIREVPGTYDKELFMRFFEELEYSITVDNIDSKEVRDMFGFYPLLAVERKDFLFKEDERDNWCMFLKFIKRMRKIKPLSKNDKGYFPLS